MFELLHRYKNSNVYLIYEIWNRKVYFTATKNNKKQHFRQKGDDADAVALKVVLLQFKTNLPVSILLSNYYIIHHPSSTTLSQPPFHQNYHSTNHPSTNHHSTNHFPNFQTTPTINPPLIHH